MFAGSSSTYGDSKELPKREEIIGKPISPYSVTKLVKELYARVFAGLYDIEFICLRYFNVFGPNQNPDGAYAAVIPKFIKAIRINQQPVIHGDGLQSRDFTYVDNVVQANIKALFIARIDAVNQTYNIAAGGRTTVLEIWKMLKEISRHRLGADI